MERNPLAQNGGLRQGGEKERGASLLEKTGQLTLRPQQPAQVALPPKIGGQGIGDGQAVGMTRRHRIQKHHPVRTQGLGQGQRDDADPRRPLPKGAAIEQGQRRGGPQRGVVVWRS